MNWLYAHRLVLYAVGCALVVLTSPQGDNNQFGSILAILAMTVAAFVMMLLPADNDDDEAR